MEFLFLSLLLQISLSMPVETAYNDSIKNVEIDEVEVTAAPHVATEMLALPITFVNKEELEVPDFFTPADALNEKAGISLSRDGIWATSVNIRGLSKERILILSDYERMQTATDIAAALSTIDMNNLERIEIIKGAASVLYGTGAMGGVVNFISSRPGYSSVFKTGGRIGTGFNTVNNLWTSHANISLSDHDWYLGVSGSFRMAQDTKTPVGKIENSRFKDASVSIQGGMMYKDNQELKIAYQYMDAWDVGLPGGSAFPAGAKVRYKDVKRSLLSGEYIIYEPLTGVSQINLKAYTQSISREVENKIEAQNLTILPSSENITSGGKLTTELDLGTKHDLIVGFEGWLRDAETKRFRIKDDADIENKQTVTREQPVPNAKMTDLGLFAQYGWKILPRKLRLDAGLRLDYIRLKNDTAYEPVYKYIQENGQQTPVDTEQKVLFEAGVSNEFSYSAHLDLVYNPARKHQLALSLSNAYRAASLEERFKYIDQAGTLSVGNPDLKPEQGVFSNLNYNFKGEKFIFSVDVFGNYLFNLITSKKSMYQLSDGSYVEALVNTNVDEALFIGAEIESSYWFVKNLWLTGSISYTRATDVQNGEFLPQIPPMKGILELNYSLRKAFTASVSTQWAAKQSEIAQGETTTDGYVLLNAAIQSQKITLNKVYLKLFAGVNNIFDTEYYNHLAINRGVVRAEPGRNIYAKILFGW